MRILALLLSLAAASLTLSAAQRIGLTPPHASSFLQKQLSSAAPTDSTPAVKFPPAQYFRPQALDHFNAHNQGHYSQRYFVNATFWNKFDGPVFLMIEGEGAASAKWAVQGHHMDMAAKFGALVFVVEHRYYGGSLPRKDLSTTNLQWLSSEQALADLAVFLESMATKYNLDIGETGRNKIIAFGGSYSGALSAWFRIKYPHLIYASVSSSAPVLAQLDFTGYNQVVAASMAASVVGGSEQCAKEIYDGFQQIEAVFNSNDALEINKLSTLFNSCSNITEALDQTNFVGTVAGTFQGTVQYNGHYPVTIATLCDFMLNASNGATAMGRLAKLTIGGNDQCMDYTLGSISYSIAEYHC
jgi:serine protease 16